MYFQKKLKIRESNKRRFNFVMLLLVFALICIDELLLAPPTFKSNKATGDRAFQVAAPSEWNKLPKSLRLENDLKSFKTKLKTYLFQKAYY